MKQSGGHDGDGGVRRRRAQDAAGRGRGPLRENSAGGDAAPTRRASTGLPPRAPPGRPPRALPGPRLLERHRDADEFPRERDTSSQEEEEATAPALAVRPRGAPRERPDEGGGSASREMAQRSAAAALGGRGRHGGHHHDIVDYLREDESPSWEAGALAVRPRGAPRERPEGGGESAFRAEDQRPASTALGGRAPRGGRHHDYVGYTRGDEFQSWDAGALVVRPRGAPRERPGGGGDSASRSENQRPATTALGGKAPRGGRDHDSVGHTRGDESPSWEAGALVVRPRGARPEDPEGAWTSNPSAAAADLGRHHGGLVSPREREPRRVEGTPRGHLQDRLCDGPLIRPEGSLRAAGKLWGFDTSGEVSDDLPQHRRGVTSPGPKDSGKGRDADGHRHAVASASQDLPPRRTPAQSVTDARDGGQSSTAAAVHDETGAETAPDPSSSEPESSSAAASGHPYPAQGGAMAPVEQVVGQQNAHIPAMAQRIVTDLIQTKAIMDVNFLEDWLVQRETLSVQTYFEVYAPITQRVWYNKWLLCAVEYTSHAPSLPSEKGFKDSKCSEIPAEKLFWMISAMADQHNRCQLEDLGKANCKAMYAIREFLCRSCLNQKPELEMLCLDIISIAANNTRNNFMIGSHLRLVGIIVIKSVIGSPDVRYQAFRVLTKLARVHTNKMMILDFGGISCAAHAIQHSVLGIESAIRMVSVVLESEYGYPKVFKDRLPYCIIEAVGEERLTETSCIEAVLEAATKIELAKSLFFERLTMLESGSRSKNLLLRILLRIAAEGADEEYEY